MIFMSAMILNAEESLYLSDVLIRAIEHFVANSMKTASTNASDGAGIMTDSRKRKLSGADAGMYEK